VGGPARVLPDPCGRREHGALLGAYLGRSAAGSGRPAAPGDIRPLDNATSLAFAAPGTVVARPTDRAAAGADSGLHPGGRRSLRHGSAAPRLTSRKEQQKVKFAGTDAVFVPSPAPSARPRP
jgi:hypothetical protein